MTKPIAPQTPKTPNEFRKDLIDQGLTLKQWAEDRGYDPEYCSRILTGLVKGTRGKSHDIKVAMGLKIVPSVVGCTNRTGSNANTQAQEA